MLEGGLELYWNHYGIREVNCCVALEQLLLFTPDEVLDSLSALSLVFKAVAHIYYRKLEILRPHSHNLGILLHYIQVRNYTYIQASEIVQSLL